MSQGSNQGVVFLPRSELDLFLFAPVIDDGNGMTLSVLSMLARAGFDPWIKAAELARMQEGKATDALASFIAALPSGPAPRIETGAVAARLAALLPSGATPASSPGQTKIGGAPLTQTYAVAILALLVSFLIGAVWMTQDRQSPARAGDPASAAAAKAAASAPPPRAFR